MTIANTMILGSGTMNRCKYCGDIAPDFSDMCDTCANLELEDIEMYEVENIEELFEELEK